MLYPVEENVERQEHKNARLDRWRRRNHRSGGSRSRTPRRREHSNGSWWLWRFGDRDGVCLSGRSEYDPGCDNQSPSAIARHHLAAGDDVRHHDRLSDPDGYAGADVREQRAMPVDLANRVSSSSSEPTEGRSVGRCRVPRTNIAMALADRTTVASGLTAEYP